MKKFSYFLSLLLFFVAGVANVQAQYYEPGSELDNMDQIAGKPVFVRTNTQETDTYMCGTKGTTTVSDDCLMMFEEADGITVDAYALPSFLTSHAPYYYQLHEASLAIDKGNNNGVPEKYAKYIDLGKDRGVIYEFEFYDREQTMQEDTNMDRKMVNFIKEQYPPGTRIRLNSMENPYTPIAPGTLHHSPQQTQSPAPFPSHKLSLT